MMCSLNAADTYCISTPQNTYIYDLFPLSVSLAVLSSDETLRLLDPRALCTESIILRDVGEQVTCCTTLDRCNLVAVAGRNGNIKIWDMRSNSLQGNITTGDVSSIISLASYSQNGLAGGSELINHEASIFLWDLRKMGSSPLLKFNQSHSDDITDLKFHPQSSNILLSGSTDGLVNIFNTYITEEEEALNQTFNHGASVHHCNFLNDFDIFALSHDEKFSIYKMSTNLEDGADCSKEVHFGDLRGILGGEYVVNVLVRAGGDAVLGIGTHSHNSFNLVKLKHRPSWKFVPEEKITLNRAHGSDIVRSFCYFDEHGIIFTGGEDGQVKAWRAFFHLFINVFTKSQEINEVIIEGEKSSEPSIAVQSPISQSQQPILEHEDLSRRDYGSEKVKKAIIYLEKYKRYNPLTPRKHSGVLSTAGQYLQTFLPRLYIHGLPSDGLQENQRLQGQLGNAVQLLEEAAQQDNPDAIYILAEMNFYGNFSHPKNYRNAFMRYQQLASLNGNSSAQHMLGFMYSTGIGGAVERDQAKALLYYTFAALNDNIRSEMALAYRYHAGIGVAANCDTAVWHYKSVADKAIKWIRSGPPGGMIWVSDSYRLADDNGGVYGEGASFSSSGNNRNKHGVHSDAHAALDDVLEYLDLMSRKGDFKATFSLGRIHYDGQKGLPRNLRSAKWYFMRVAKLYWQRDGRIIESDKPGLEKVATKAAGYLGRMFLRGEGVEQSFDKAQIWFQRGIKSGDAGSQWGMGLMLLEGLGMPKNPVRATEYFKAAADQDFAPAQVSLGALYLDQGTSSDILVATRYFELAERYGNLEAYYFLAEIMNQGVGRDRNCGLASMYYKSVAEKVEPLLSSFTEANQAYINGDYELALIDYMHAAEQGWEKGQANVAYLLDDQKSLLNFPNWLSFSRPRPELLKNRALALLYWTRSSRQSNIDSLVKMGDYYLKGIGTPADMEKAASCYTAACEYKKSAMALYNLAWMHENGAGLVQDFHLAKRYYDLALETNEEAYLPVTLSLLKLRIRSAWNTLTNGRVNSIQDEPLLHKQWSPSEWVRNFLRDEKRYPRDGELEANFLPETNPMLVGNTDGLYDDNNEDKILESLIIFGLCASLVFLIWYRQQRLQRQHREFIGTQNRGVVAPQQNLYPQRGDTEVAQQAAGDAGH